MTLNMTVLQVRCGNKVTGTLLNILPRCTRFTNNLFNCRHFSVQSQQIRQISTSLTKILEEYDKSKFELAPYRLRSFQAGSCFSKAQIQSIQYAMHNDTKTICEPELLRDSRDAFTITSSFESLFERGFNTVNKYVGDLVKVPTTEVEFKETSAVVALLRFIKSYEKHQMSLRDTLKTQNKDETAVLLGNHLLSRLTSTGEYSITYHAKTKFGRCPCSQNCGMSVKYDVVGIGSEELWYGHPDIILEPFFFHDEFTSCPVLIPKEMGRENEDISEMHEENEIYEAGLLRSTSTVQQCIAQTIMFSLYRNKTYERRIDTTLPQITLVPTVAITPESFDVYLYDSKYDILLRNIGEPIPLWNNFPIRSNMRELNLSSILQLWMILHHSLFGPTFFEDEIDDLKFTCGFQEKIGTEQLAIIKNGIEKKANFLSEGVPERNFTRIKSIFESKRNKH